jgi:hypothetical protein
MHIDLIEFSGVSLCSVNPATPKVSIPFSQNAFERSSSVVGKVVGPLESLVAIFRLWCVLVP